jgi:hypothetical protein
MSRWRRVGTALALLLVLYAGMFMVALGALSELPSVPVDITINGQPLISGFDPGSMPTEHQMVIAAALALAALVLVFLVVVVLLPLALLLLALPLALAVVVLLAVLSPLIVIGWWLWRTLVTSRRSSTIAA